MKATRVFNGDDLRSTVAEIEECMDALNEAAADLKAAKKRARAQGFDLSALGTAIKEKRAKDGDRVQERRAITELYRQALGLTPMEEIMAAGGEAGDGSGAAERPANGAEAEAGLPSPERSPGSAQAGATMQ